MMPETKTLSKVEQFALLSAREKAQEAGALFNDLNVEVTKAHGIKEADAPDWQFTRDFSAMIYVPRPRPESTGAGLDVPVEKA
jgi:hypothetical protein